MKHLDLTLPTPEENLACDEALLDAAEAGEGGEVLRFWQPATHFVVVGYSNKVANEVNVPACKNHGVPILRRCSGGGTVLQGPGCLNYALILKMKGNNSLANISAANQFIMEQHRDALQSLLNRHVTVEGHTDLALDGLKFSGNSQRRRKRFLLFHGSVLLSLDLALMETLLPPPSKQPAYRQHRRHRDFLVNLQLPAESMQTALANAWQVTASSTNLPQLRITTLVQQKYSARDWTMKL